MQSGKLKSCGCIEEMKDNIFLFSQKFALIFLSFPMMWILNKWNDGKLSAFFLYQDLAYFVIWLIYNFGNLASQETNKVWIKISNRMWYVLSFYFLAIIDLKRFPIASHRGLHFHEFTFLLFLLSSIKTQYQQRVIKICSFEFLFWLKFFGTIKFLHFLSQTIQWLPTFFSRQEIVLHIFHIFDNIDLSHMT